MNAPRRLAVLVVAIVAAAASFATPAQSLEALRAARDRAKADLARAQEAFSRADEDYIAALSGASSRSTPAADKAAPAATQPPPTHALSGSAVPSRVADSRPIEVTFAMNGTGALQASPFAYRARLIVDGSPAPWTEHASGAKQIAPPATRALAYEVQHDEKTDATNPAWNMVCQGTLPLKPRSTVEIVIERGIACASK